MILTPPFIIGGYCEGLPYIKTTKEIDMKREYTYAELCRMTKKRVIRIAGYKNIKHLMGDFKEHTGDKKPFSKKMIARMIASDR